jgi:prepilin-type N-terminal cleavage/methylation domain-containing protein
MVVWETMRRRRHEKGFTLIEVMVTVAVIGVLALIAIPVFTKESRKSGASSEVSAMFGELAVRQEQYRLENGTYLATAACPSAPSAQAQDASPCIAPGTDWARLRVRLPTETLRCSYVTEVGSGTGTDNPDGFTFSSPPGSWFYIIATCDMDGDGATTSKYFVSSVDSKIQSQNEGS